VCAVPEPPRLQCSLHAIGHGAHVRAPARPDCFLVHDHDPVGAPYEPHQRTLRTALPAPETRAGRDMAHASLAGGSGSAPTDSAPVAGAAAAAAASAAACAWAAIHSSAAA